MRGAEVIAVAPRRGSAAGCASSRVASSTSRWPSTPAPPCAWPVPSGGASSRWCARPAPSRSRAWPGRRLRHAPIDADPPRRPVTATAGPPPSADTVEDGRPRGGGGPSRPPPAGGDGLEPGAAVSGPVTELTVAVVASTRAWRSELQAYVRNHVSGHAPGGGARAPGAVRRRLRRGRDRRRRLHARPLQRAPAAGAGGGHRRGLRPDEDDGVGSRTLQRAGRRRDRRTPAPGPRRCCGRSPILGPAAALGDEVRELLDSIETGGAGAGPAPERLVGPPPDHGGRRGRGGRRRRGGREPGQRPRGPGRAHGGGRRQRGQPGAGPALLLRPRAQPAQRPRLRCATATSTREPRPGPGHPQRGGQRHGGVGRHRRPGQRGRLGPAARRRPGCPARRAARAVGTGWWPSPAPTWRSSTAWARSDSGPPGRRWPPPTRWWG